MTPIKDPAESVVVEFDFTDELSTIDSATVTVAVFGTGTDPDMAAMVDGAVQISGSSVLQRIKGGVSGLAYTLRCVAVGGSDIRVRADTMPVRVA